MFKKSKDTVIKNAVENLGKEEQKLRKELSEFLQKDKNVTSVEKALVDSSTPYCSSPRTYKEKFFVKGLPKEEAEKQVDAFIELANVVGKEKPFDNHKNRLTQLVSPNGEGGYKIDFGILDISDTKRPFTDVDGKTVPLSPPGHIFSPSGEKIKLKSQNFSCIGVNGNTDSVYIKEIRKMAKSYRKSLDNFKKIQRRFGKEEIARITSSSKELSVSQVVAQKANSK